MAPNVILRMDPDLCTACRACELACHFRHTGRFGTSQSSIHINYRADIGEVAIHIDPTCDLCGGKPFCVEFCSFRALTIGEQSIQKSLDNTGSSGTRGYKGNGKNHLG